MMHDTDISAAADAQAGAAGMNAHDPRALTGEPAAGDNASPSRDGPMCSAALECAAMGFEVFPVPLGTKQSHKSAEFSGGAQWGKTTNHKIIRQDFGRWRDANLGVATGAASGIFVIEADTVAGHGVDGLASIKELEATQGALPDTLMAISPSGSVHRYYRHPGEGVKIWSSAGDLAPGVDIKGDGGMVIAPPSIKPGVGVYEWLNEGHPIVDAPDWLIAFARLSKEERRALLNNDESSIIDFNIAIPAMSAASPVSAKRERAWCEAVLAGEADKVACTAAGGRNVQLNNSAMACGHWIGPGRLSEQEVEYRLLAACAANGLLQDKENGGQSRCMATIRSGLQAGMREPGVIPDRTIPAQSAEASESPAAATEPRIVATPYVWTEPDKIPPREFLYGRRLIRKYPTATIAPGGVGKTALEVAEVLSMVSGRPLLGVQTPQLRVWLWSLEDPREEMERRVQATAKHYRLTRADIGDRLFLDSGREQPLVIAEAVRNGFVVFRPVVDALVAQLKERAIDVLIIDPFVSCHRVTENDNAAIDAVTKTWASVANDANCAVELVHHVRKGEQEITVESARGGGSFGDACRMVRVINRMTEQQGQDAGVANHRLHFRTYLDKNNLAPPADKSDWYKLVSVDLGNGPLGPNVLGGDSIGVVTKWEWPDATKDLTGRDFDKVAAAIRAGNWRADVQAKQWVGRAVAKALAFDLDNRADKAKVKQLLKYWIGTGALVVVEHHTEKRETKEFVEVAEKVE